MVFSCVSTLDQIRVGAFLLELVIVLQVNWRSAAAAAAMEGFRNRKWQVPKAREEQDKQKRLPRETDGVTTHELHKCY